MLSFGQIGPKNNIKVEHEKEVTGTGTEIDWNVLRIVWCSILRLLNRVLLRKC
jgi:hypothetical protein